MVAGCTALLLISCASQQPQMRTALPADVSNPLPSPPGTPELLASFIGVWAGRWDAITSGMTAHSVTQDITFIVQNVMPHTDDLYRGYLLYSWGASSMNLALSPGLVRLSGSFGPDGVLRIDGLPHGAAMTLRMREDRQNLRAEYRAVSSVNGMPYTMAGTLWRTTLP
jgi:hypothetical protein